MKKTIFYISLILCLILVVNILNILTNDLDRLTEYGFGYLIGKIILFMLFFILILFTKKNILKKKRTD